MRPVEAGLARSNRSVRFGILALAARSATWLVAPGLSPHAAQGAEAMAFTPAALDAARASGKPILLEVTAPWCETCRSQKPVLSRLLAEPAYADVLIFSIDLESQKPTLRKLGVSAAGTLIVYRGGREAARSTGETDAARIRALVDAAY